MSAPGEHLEDCSLLDKRIIIEEICYNIGIMTGGHSEYPQRAKIVLDALIEVQLSIHGLLFLCYK